MSNTIRLKSTRFDREFDAEVYQKESFLIITHSSLKQIYTLELSDEERPMAEFDIVDLSKLPGIPPMFAIKCIMKSNDFYCEQYGEMLCQAWQESDEITRNNPLAICSNRAFDKAFIRFMEFKIPVKGILNIYSSEETPVDTKAVSLMNIMAGNSYQGTTDNRNLQESQIPQRQNQQSVPETIPSVNNTPPQQWNPSQMNNSQRNNIPPQQWNPSQTNNIQNNYPQILVRRVSYEPAFRKTKVETNHGIFLFDPQTGVWESQSADRQSVDTRILYVEASRKIGFELRNYNG